ncbi:IMP dehydrogenase, partial [Oenococcus oeni]
MEVFDYENVQLIPNKCLISSRSEADTSVEFGGHRFKLPVVPANMASVIDDKLAIWLAENGYFYIMHRFEPGKRFNFVTDMKQRGLISSISVGVKEEEYRLIDELVDAGLTPDYITIDIAHGYA